MTLADFDTLFAHSDVCREQLRDVLLRHEELFARPFPTTSRYDTIQKLMAHCVGAEERWITVRIRGETLPVVYEDRAADTVEGLFADAGTVRGVTDDFRRSLDKDSLRRMISIRLPQRDAELELSLSDIFFHILNHENFHRGQVILSLRQFGVDPPDFDYVLLKSATSL
ncbi:MAG: DinB family protein [Akkermansiaceae bacterium]|nr:DinB family protein [Armatimonadota bacterium]